MRKLTFYICLACVLVLSSVGYAEWHDAAAQVRFQIATVGRPSHNSAGYIVVIPDGGILPGSKVDVISKSGQKIKSAVLWHSKLHGLVIVVDSTMETGAYAYVSFGKSPVWTPASGLTPSPLIARMPGVDDMSVAQKLGALGVVSPNVHVMRMIGHMKDAFAIQKDPSGRPAPVSMYGLIYIDLAKAGNTFFSYNAGVEAKKYPNPPQGKVELKVNGTTVGKRPVYPYFGGTGKAINCEAGPNRVEVYATCRRLGAGEEDGGIVWMTLREPGVKLEDVAGRWSIDKKVEIPGGCKHGGPKQASRVLGEYEIVRSGKTRILSLEQKQGKPLAAMTATPVENLWGLAEGPPSIVYVFNALTEGNPDDSKYEWSFSDGSKMTGPQIVRFMAGLREHKVQLKVVSEKGQSTCVQSFYGYTDVETSMDDEEARSNIRSAFLGSIRAFPKEKDPTVGWSPNTWEALYQVQEMGKGAALLVELLTKRWDFIKDKLKPEYKDILQQDFFLWISSYQPETAIKWLEKMELQERDRTRKDKLSLMRAEVYMYQLNNLDKAREIVKSFLYKNSEVKNLAKVRMGDIEFLAGNLNEATKFYGEVQSAYKYGEKSGSGTPPKLSHLTGLKRPSDFKDEANLGKKSKGKRGGKKGEEKAFVSSINVNDKVEDWKKGAILDTSRSETVISMIQQGHLREAKQNLDTWEGEFPLSKITGDFIIQDAKFYMAIGNYVRARKLLETYCKEIDASSYMYEAADKLFACMSEMKAPKEELVKFCKEMKERFEFSPVATKMDDMLNMLNGNGVKRMKTRDQF